MRSATSRTYARGMREIPAAQWRDAVASALEDGWSFAGLHASRDDAEPALRCVLLRDAEERVLSMRAGDRRADSVVDLLPAAVWDEREAHDLHGWHFSGHEPMRPLVDHDVAPEAWTVAVEGRDAHRVAVGPIHAGVIESGHFRFAVVGERILHLDLQLFYKHRGLEAAAEGRTYDEGARIVQRACASGAVSNTVAYAQACEAALGWWPHDDVRRARTVLVELERLTSHLNDVSAICAGVGFAPGTMLFAALKERAQRLNRALTGHRFLFGTVAVGGSCLRIDRAAASAARRELDALRAEVARGWRELQFTGSLQERLDGVGVTTRAETLALGGVGPVARAAGVREDRRTASPRLLYEGFVPAAPERATGDVAARWQMRGAELPATLALLDALLADPLAPAGVRTLPGPPPGAATATVEGPRGRTLCAVELDGRRVARVHLRTGSYANWPLLALAVSGELLPDFPLVNKSFELCYACVDR